MSKNVVRISRPVLTGLMKVAVVPSAPVSVKADRSFVRNLKVVLRVESQLFL